MCETEIVDVVALCASRIFQAFTAVRCYMDNVSCWRHFTDVDLQVEIVDIASVGSTACFYMVPSYGNNTCIKYNVLMSVKLPAELNHDILQPSQVNSEIMSCKRLRKAPSKTL